MPVRAYTGKSLQVIIASETLKRSECRIDRSSPDDALRPECRASRKFIL
jgi:hypothetical protein